LPIRFGSQKQDYDKSLPGHKPDCSCHECYLYRSGVVTPKAKELLAQHSKASGAVNLIKRHINPLPKELIADNLWLLCDERQVYHHKDIATETKRFHDVMDAVREINNAMDRLKALVREYEEDPVW